MSNIKIFESPMFGTIRAIEEQEKILFCGSDVAKALGYANAPDALYRHCRAIVKRDTPISGKIQEVNFIAEGDLYRLIVNSKLPAAEQFEHWVFDDVLPSIRKHGMYAVDELIENPDIAIQAFTALKAERERRAKLEAQLEQDKPKVLFADAVSASKTTILIGELAKILKQNGVNVGQNRLFEWLREHGYLINRRGTDYNMPTQRSMEMGLFEIKETAITHSDGHNNISKTTKVTGRGQQYFISKFLEQ